MAATLPHNDSPQFAGLDAIKTAQREQLAKFEAAASRGRWKDIHHDHYDWWMFPVDSPSSHGLKWTVYAGDIDELEHDSTFLRDYRRGVELLMLAWGWDLDRQEFVPDPAPGQEWQQWPVRLYKAAYSLWLFGFATEFASLRKYALALMERGEDFGYGHRDLGVFFTQGLDPYNRQWVYPPGPLLD